MSAPRLEDVFKTSGVPTYTFVAPIEYADLLLSLRTPGRGVVIEGPSGIGKTTGIETALQNLGMNEKAVTKLSARRPPDVEYIEALPEMGAAGIVIVDDFHKLSDKTRAALADYLKTLADEESKETKIIVVGINRAGENLIGFAHDLVNRLDVIPFESNPDDKVRELILRGTDALNVSINVVDEIVAASQGSFYLAQMLCREVCKRSNILERCDERTTIEVSFESIRADVWDRLAQVFQARCERFCRGTKMRREGRAPYLHILRWLAECAEWTLSLREAIRQHPAMRGSVSQVVDKSYLDELIDNDTDISAAIHYDTGSEQLTVEDPQFIFFIRNIAWKRFATDLGFLEVDFKNRYDFALLFAGEDREIAEGIFNRLQDAQTEVFYDKNERHRILAEDVEQYLRPIYQSEARFVIVLLTADYPKKVWTKFESDNFKQRFGDGAVIPIWFTDAPAGAFDESRQYGGYTVDRDKPIGAQLDEISQILLEKLTEAR